jgi:hypothetical protein
VSVAETSGAASGGGAMFETMLATPRRELWMWSQADREAAQLLVARERFETLRPKIPQLAKLADLQQVKSIGSLDDLAPLLFQHTVYKSYPISLITKGRFDLLTRWLDGVSRHDLSQVDASDCAGFDDWFDRLEAQSPLRPHHSTGTTGKLSIIPRDQADLDRFEQLFMRAYEPFGDEPDPVELLRKGGEPIPIVHPSYRHGRHLAQRMMDALVRHIGSEETTYVLFDDYLSADIMSLVGQVRGASMRGALGEMTLAPEVLERYRTLIERQARQAEHQAAFFERIVRELKGRGVYVVGVTAMLYEWTLKGEERGIDQLFAPESVIASGGGMKGIVVPDDWQARVEGFLGAPLRFGYGMSEAMGGAGMCAMGHYHPLPFTIPFVLDAETGAPMPRTGTQTGRYAFLDLFTEAFWGGFVTGDRVTVTWDGCGCGRRGPYVHPQIERFSELEGGDDKVSCSGSVDAHKEAMDWLVAQTGTTP